MWIDTVDAPPNGETLVERAMRTWTRAATGASRSRSDGAARAVVRVHFMAADYRYGVTAPRVDRQTASSSGRKWR